MASKNLSSPKTFPNENPLDLAEACREPLFRYSPATTWWPIVIGLLIAIGARAFFFFEPLWLDELHTAWVVDGPFSQIGQRAAAGNQSPLYFWLVWPITFLASLSPTSLRILSLVAGLWIVVFSGQLVLKWTNSLAASATAVFLIAIDPTLIFYATEARPFALVQLVGCFQIAMLWKLWDDLVNGDNQSRKRTWIYIVSLSVCSAILFFLHYTSALLFFAEAVFVSVGLSARRLRGQPYKEAFTKFLAAAGLTLLLCIPTARHLFFVSGRSQNWASISSVEQLLTEQMMPIVVLVGVPLAIACALWLARQLNTNGLATRIQLLGLLSAAALVPIVLACIGDRLQLFPLALTRYVVISGVAMILFTAVVVGSAQSKTVQWVLAVILVGGNLFFNPIVQSLPTNGDVVPFRHEMWEPPIAQINQHDAQLQRPVFLFANVLEDRDAAIDLDSMFQNYLKFPVRGIYKIENANRILPKSSIADIPLNPSDISMIEGQGSAWLLFRSTRQQATRIISTIEMQLQNPVQVDVFSSPDSDVILVLLTVAHKL